MKFNKFLSSLSSSKIHSNGIADTANPESFGATSAQSFTQRRQIEKNRQIIGGYRDAGVLHGYREEARFGTGEKKVVATGNTPPSSTEPVYGQNRQPTGSRIDIVKPSRQAFNARPSVARPVQTFREPPTRGYNPYS